ncbi:MAG: hypothetical protein OEV40_18820, partial [Acidimicrobiia bacterium]|nr:hypothetical protein [Acidimicrobiia bacterium]
AVVFGLIGAGVGTLFKLWMLATRRLASGSAWYSASSVMALPLTLFLGTDGLDDVTSEPAALGAGLIL